MTKKLHESAVCQGNPDDRPGTSRSKERMKTKEELQSLVSNYHNLPKGAVHLLSHISLTPTF